jgi:hypothetical protein
MASLSGSQLTVPWVLRWLAVKLVVNGEWHMKMMMYGKEAGNWNEAEVTSVRISTNKTGTWTRYFYNLSL